MRRTIAALLIFAAALGFSACCEAYSLRVTQTLCSGAQSIKQQAQAGAVSYTHLTLPTKLEV